CGAHHHLRCARGEPGQHPERSNRTAPGMKPAAGGYTMAGGVSEMERTMSVNGSAYQFAATYDGDSQYNVQVHSGDKLITMFKVAAESEQDVFDAALARFKADVELGNVKV
ncbi:hypothetical protein, partial [Anoxybacillus sp. LAT27]|uniref:hypothetical protein n=2 Tax=Bacillales TaxID=1385 RepID=UPI0031F8AB1C